MTCEEHALRVFLHDLCRVPDEHAQRHWVLESRTRPRLAPAELLDHLRDCHPVLLPDHIQQPERVVLRDVARARDRLLALVRARRRAAPAEVPAA